MGFLPGLTSTPLFGPETIKPNSSPYSIYASLGLVATAALLIAYHPKAMGWALIMKSKRARRGLILGLGAACTALIAAWLAGGILWEPGLPRTEVVLVWLVGQALTIVIEESFFRGTIQRHLASWFTPGVGIGVAALLFGLAHAQGGPVWMLSAMLADLGTSNPPGAETARSSSWMRILPSRRNRTISTWPSPRPTPGSSTTARAPPTFRSTRATARPALPKGVWHR
jgi:hypothetical protein